MFKVRKYKSAFIIPLLLAAYISSAQDVVFNHPYAGMLYSNPAYTGIFGQWHAGATFRSQFTASAAPYTTYYTEADAFIENWNSGFGVYIINDRSAGGQLAQTAVGLSYMFNLKISEDLTLRPALQAVYHNKNRDFNTFTFPDQIDITGNSITLSDNNYEPFSVNAIDFSAGLLALYYNLEIGVAVHHLGAPKGENVAGVPLKYIAQAKYTWDWEQVKLVPYIQYIYQDVYQYLTGGLLLQTGVVFAGGGIKTALQQNVGNIALSAGFITADFRIGYSMDFIAFGSSLNAWTGMSHEIFVHFSFGSSKSGDRGRGRGRKWTTRSTCGCYL